MDGLSGRLHDRPQLLRTDRLPRILGRDRQLPHGLYELVLRHRDQEQRDLGGGRPGVRDRDRPSLCRPDGAHPLVGRVQDGCVPADGDLRVRDRRDVADPLRPGSESRSDQRPGAGRLGRGHVAGRPLDRESIDVVAPATRRRAPPEDAAPSGRRGAARPDGDRAAGHADGCETGGEAGTEAG